MSLTVGIQLFSVRDHMEKDPAGTLREIASMGYTAIEPCNGSYGMDPSDFRALCDELGLRIICAHLGSYELNEKTEETLVLYKTLGVSYLAIAGFWGDCVYGGRDYPAMMEKLQKSAAYFKENGIQILYHNHDREFQKDNDIYHLDHILSAFDGNLLLPEIDTCWAAIGHGDPQDYIKRYSGRCPIIHLKDFSCHASYKSGNLGNGLPEGFEIRPVGYGRLDIVDILHTAEAIGTEWLIVEQDSPCFGLSQLECARLSRQWLSLQGF
ncbi:MAG: sugar phosphate isomerase/epimerase [Clostridia bacterium]|nr:sugar phosphate isomerase/epimerase [Clostridia bacterium]